MYYREGFLTCRPPPLVKDGAAARGDVIRGPSGHNLSRSWKVYTRGSPPHQTTATVRKFLSLRVRDVTTNTRLTQITISAGLNIPSNHAIEAHPGMAAGGNQQTDNHLEELTFSNRPAQTQTTKRNP
jgi:hypothetical protein